MIRLKIAWSLFLVMFLVLALCPIQPSIAQVSVQVNIGEPSGPNLGLEYPSSAGLTNADPRVIFGNIVRVALGLIGIILVGLTFWGGFLWMTAGGNSDNIDKAKEIISASVIGLAIVLSAYAIATFVMVKILGATSGAGSSIF